MSRFSVILFFTIPMLAQVDVLTRHNDSARTGANLQETQLTVASVSGGRFGKLVYRTVDGNPYAQPLIVSGARVPGRSAAEMVIVATQHNSVYAFDGNDIDPKSTTAQIWHTGPTVLGKAVDSQQLYDDLGKSDCTDLTTEVGITGTPAIQLKQAQVPKEGVIFVVAKSRNQGVYTYSLFALNLATGAKLGQTQIQGEVEGRGIASVRTNEKSVIRFNAKYELNRPALLLSGNILYLAFGGHCDQGPYHGWVFAYDVTNPAALKRVAVFCDTLNGTGAETEGRAGIWMSGEGPAVDENGFVYVATGDGTYNGITDFGNSLLKLRLAGKQLRVADWFTPTNQEFLKEHDIDLGSGGVVVIPNSHLLLTGGKEGKLYLINREHMGKGAEISVPSIQVTHIRDGENSYNLHGAAALWPSASHIFVYLNGEENPFQQYRLVPDSRPGSTGWKFDPPNAPFKSTSDCAKQPTCLTSPFPNFPLGLFGHGNRGEVWMPGGFGTVSANGGIAGSGVLWVAMPFAANANHEVVRGVLRALDASDVSRPELWNSENSGNGNDQLGQYAKFCPPVVANGKVYLVTFQEERIMQGKHYAAPPPADQPALVVYGLSTP